MKKKLQKIIIYGKGGIGKSMIASNLSMVYANQNLRVLQIGCDPKHDSIIHLLKEKKIATVMDAFLKKHRNIKKEDIIMKGKNNIDCIECGGPKPGTGCAGRGISLMFEILNDLSILDDYDVIIYDVLGDVVCGGFAAPLKLGFGEKVFIVLSEELSSLYVAKNIIYAVNYYKTNRIYLGGLILNLRDNQADLKHFHRFAEKANADILEKIPRSKKIAQAESDSKTVVEKYPSSDISRIFSELADKILICNKNTVKKPRYIDDEIFYKIFYHVQE